MSASGDSTRGRGSRSERSRRSAARSTATRPRTFVSDYGGEEGDNIRVVVRVRPVMDFERTRGDVPVVFPREDAPGVKLEASGTGGQSIDKNYVFNACFGQDATQQSFFEACGVRELLNSVMEGYSATVFAYGQTGSGKTYSMSGLEERISSERYEGDEKDGIMPRSLQYIFETVARVEESSPVGFTLRASYCEIYNEQVFDLLNPASGALPVRWNSHQGFYVQDLFVVTCESLEDIMAVVSEGHRNRRIASHEMNKDSSRSHSLLTLYVKSETVDEVDGRPVPRFGKVVFVDLAGSERLKESQSEGQTKVETGSINKSLFTLGKVIATLSDKGRGKADVHIPYRDSKLTKLLMDSLGGSSMALMVACISPASYYLEETISTLNYATRAKNIRNKPVVKMDPKDQLIAGLRRDLHLARAENQHLRLQLRAAADGLSVDRGLLPSSSQSSIYSQTPLSTPSVTPARTPVHSRRGSAQGGGYAYLPPGSAGSSSSGMSRATRAHRIPPLDRASTDPSSDSLVHGLAASGQAAPEGGDNPGSRTANKATRSQDRLIREYKHEVERLQRENREVRGRGTMAERSYRQVMEENERLSDKLSRLERVFVSSSTPSLGDDLMDGGGLERTQRLSEENARLRAALHSAREEAERLRRQAQGRRAPGEGEEDGSGGEAKASEGGVAAPAARRSTGLDKKEQRELFSTQQANAQLRKHVAKLQRKELALLKQLEDYERREQSRARHADAGSAAPRGRGSRGRARSGEAPALDGAAGTGEGGGHSYSAGAASPIHAEPRSPPRGGGPRRQATPPLAPSPRTSKFGHSQRALRAGGTGNEPPTLYGSSTGK